MDRSIQEDRGDHGGKENMKSPWRERRPERARGLIPIKYLNCPSLKLISTVKIRRVPISIKDARVIERDPEWIQETLGS